MADNTIQPQEIPQWTIILESLERLAHLPAWLECAADSEQITDALRSNIPEFISGTLSLQECRVSHLRISNDGTHWSGTYQCTIADPTTTQPRSVELLGIVIPPHMPVPDVQCTPVAFASDGWHWFIPNLRMAFELQPPEAQLDALSELTDPQLARVVLQQCFDDIAHTQIQSRLAACRPEILRYHPGLRCTVGYHLMYHGDEAPSLAGPAFVVAKTYDDDRGQTAYQAMDALWRSPLGTSRTVAIAEPIAYIAARRLLLQGPLAEEQTLQSLLKSALLTQSTSSAAQLHDYLRQTARGLVELHGSGISVGAHHHWHDEMTSVRAFVERLATAIPALTATASSLFMFLEQIAREYPADPLVPCHGTFRPSQVLLHQGRIGFIDFDSFCQAEPAMDIALFMVALVDSGMSVFATNQSAMPPYTLRDFLDEHHAQIEAIAESFLSHYAALRPISYPRVGLWRALNTLEVVARSWDRVKPKRLNHTIPMLEQQLRMYASKELGAAS
jgi:hypothetical protein